MFDPDSRYHDAEIVETVRHGRAVRYARWRVLPQGRAMPALGEVTVRQGDRLDLIAARALGDPARYWRLCDANDAMNPDDLTATPGATLTVPAPQP